MEVSPGFRTRYEDQLVILTGIRTTDFGERVGGEGRGQGRERGREAAVAPCLRWVCKVEVIFIIL